MLFNLDVAIFFSFLALNLGVGLWYSRGVKTLRQYAVGDKQFPTIVIALTIAATCLSSYGSIIGVGILKSGLLGCIRRVWNHLFFLFIGILYLRGERFLRYLTLAETMGSVYGATIRAAVALSCIGVGIGIVGLQFKVAAIALHDIFGYDRVWIAILISGIVTFYASLGGIKAVTFTDVLQFIFIAGCMPLLLVLIASYIPLPYWMIPKRVLSEANMLVSSLWSSKKNITTLLLHFIRPTLLPFSAAAFQRFLMAKNVYQAKRAFSYATVI